MVPNGWKYTKLGEVAELQRGFDLPHSQREHGEIPIISSAGITGFHSTYKATPPGVVTGRYGSIGEIFYITENYWPLNTSLWVKNFHGNHEKFIYYLFTTFDFKKFSDKTGVPGINRNDVHAIKVLVPPIQEQQKIAEILSTWDKAITSTENLIANSEMQKKALMQQLLTGKKRLLDEDGIRFSGEWKRTQLKTFLTESTLRNKNSNIDRVLSITNHSGFVLPEEQFSKRVASNNVENYKVVTNGQFGYNPSRLNVGSFGRLDQYENGVLSPMYVIFNVDTSKIHSDYFLFWMGSGEANQRIKNSTQGSVRESVGFDALCAIPFNLPSISEQEKIAGVLSNANREIELLQAKLEHLKQEKKALMQQLLTGKRRVVIN